MADYDPLDLIERYESGGKNVPNYRYDPKHTAGGFFQITDQTWRGTAPAAGIDLGQYPTALSAPRDIQRQVASTLFSKQGWSPWAPFNPRLAAAIGQGGGQGSAAAKPPEGYFDGGLHVNIPAPPHDDHLAGMYLLGKLMDGGRAAGDPEPGQDDGAMLLQSLMGPPGEPPEGTKPSGATDAVPPTEGPPPFSVAPRTEAEPLLPAGEIKPIGPQSAPAAPPVDQSQGMELLNRLMGMASPVAPAHAAEVPDSGFVEPPGAGQRVPPIPQQPAPPAPTGPAPLPTAPVVEPGQQPPGDGRSILERLLKGAAEGVALPREELGERGLLPVHGEAESIGAAAGRVPSMFLLDPIRAGAGQLEAAQKGEPLDPTQMLTAAGGAMTGGIAPSGAVAAGLGRGPGFMPKVEPTGAVGKAMGAARKTINEIFSPTTVDPTSLEAESLIRQSTGMARRETEAANAALEEYRPLVNPHMPEFMSWMQAKTAGMLPADAPKPGLLRFLDFVETRSSGAKYDGPAELRPLADELRRVYRERRMAIEAEPTTEDAGFIEDYYSHQWKERERARAAMATGHQGSGRSLKERSIPTISEGIERGLTPVTLDPIAMTMGYVANMDRYLAHNRTFRISRDAGIVQFHAPGAQPEGWAPLQGRMAETPGKRAYAPEAFARVYNNAISSGVYADRLGGQVYNAILKTKNTLNSFVLGLSGYHAAAMAQEASASALARALGGVAEADMNAVAKQLGLGGMPVAKSVNDVISTGRKLQRQYLRIDDYGADYEKVAKLLAEGGGRIIGRGQEWRGTAADNFFKAWKRGALKIDAMTSMNEVRDAPLRAPLVAARELAKLNDTIMAPIFDGMIPRLKSAAFFDEMNAWLKANPEADRTAQLAKSRQLVDVIDDRFGEMILDNIFWGKRTKQFLQLATTSLGWELGTLRSGLGAGADIARGNVWSPRVRYLVGLAGAVGLYNASYQYLMTGQGPQGALDLVSPRTGGMTPEGAPERALLPGYEKDALGWWHSPTTEFAGKLSPLGRIGGELITGKDYFGHEIAPFAPGTPDWFKAYGRHVMQAMMPIPLKQEVLKGSNMGMAQRFMGNRPAPEYIQNPQRFDDMETRRRLGDLRGQLRGLYAHGARTQEERSSIEKKASEIRRRIQKTVDDAKQRKLDRAPAPEPRRSVGGP